MPKRITREGWQGNFESCFQVGDYWEGSPESLAEFVHGTYLPEKEVVIGTAINANSTALVFENAGHDLYVYAGYKDVDLI